MKKFASSGLAALLVLLGLLTLATTAHAAAGVSLSVNHRVLYSSEHLRVTARSGASCSWVVTWNGARRGGTGTTLVSDFVAPRVTRITKLQLEARCFLAAPPVRTRPVADRVAVAPASTDSQQIVVRVPGSVRATLVITVLPGGSSVSPPGGTGGTGGVGGELPNTGGPSLLLLLVGLGSALVGAVVVRSSRGRPAL